MTWGEQINAESGNLKTLSPVLAKLVEKSQRSVSLPFGCTDLIDLQPIGSSTLASGLDQVPLNTDQLAYIGGYLSGVLETDGRAQAVFISGFHGQGIIIVVREPALAQPVLAAAWSNGTQQHAIASECDELEILAYDKPVRHPSCKHALAYRLPETSAAAASLIIGLLRRVYGLGDLATIRLYRYGSVAAACELLAGCGNACEGLAPRHTANDPRSA